MKIQELRIHNFQSIDQLTLPLAPVTLVTGPNGAGKSSIQAALEFLVSGATTHTSSDRVRAMSSQTLRPSA